MQFVVDIVVQFLPVVRPLLPRVLNLLAGFVARPHEELSTAGAKALGWLLKASGEQLTKEEWQLVITVLAKLGSDTLPDVYSLVGPLPPEVRLSGAMILPTGPSLWRFVMRAFRSTWSRGGARRRT